MRVMDLIILVVWSVVLGSVLTGGFLGGIFTMLLGAASLVAPGIAGVETIPSSLLLIAIGFAFSCLSMAIWKKVSISL